MEGDPSLLPAEVLLKIFSYCSYRELVKFQFVCRWWQQVSRHKCLWRDIVYKPFTSNSTQEIINNLKASPELRALDLRHVKCTTVTKELVEELVNGCPNLEQLSASWFILHEKIHLEINKIKVLILDQDLFISNICFKHLHDCFPNVEHLYCNDILFEDIDFKAYLKKKGRSLLTLDVPCALIMHKCILPYLSVCTNLKSLNLIYMCNEFGRLPVESVERFKQISSLTLRKSMWFSNSDNSSMFTYFPNLVELELHKCIVHNEQELFMIAENCPLVEKLTLSYLTGEDDILKYVSNFKKLTFLCLKNLESITDDCVAHLQPISELMYLDILDCEELTPQCLFALCSFDKLQTLKFDLQGYDPPEELGARHVKNPDLHIMFYHFYNRSVMDHLRSQGLRLSLLKGYAVNDLILQMQGHTIDD